MTLFLITFSHFQEQNYWVNRYEHVKALKINYHICIQKVCFNFSSQQYVFSSLKKKSLISWYHPNCIESVIDLSFVILSTIPMLTSSLFRRQKNIHLHIILGFFFKDSFSYIELYNLYEISECTRVFHYGGGVLFLHSFMLACGRLFFDSFAQISTKAGDLSNW